MILSHEGVTQGDPLAIALYGVALLPLAENLRSEHPDVLQPWYANNEAMQGLPLAVAKCFQLLIRVGPQFGYYPKPNKSFAICQCPHGHDSVEVGVLGQLLPPLRDEAYRPVLAL